MVNIKVVETVNLLIKDCGRCDLRNNGTAIPFIGKNPKAIILGEAPGKDEVVDGVPFVGKSGKYLFEVFNLNGYTRDNFIIINTAQCRPVKKTATGETNGKPTKKHLISCMPFVSTVLFHSGLNHIIGLGNYPKYWIDVYNNNSKCKIGGISSVVGETITITSNLDRNISKSFTYCYHPASVIYDSKKKDKFEEVIKSFCKGVDNA